ncbi:hypothetical protein SprV_0200788600 [Sparganum proliferum]
MVLLVHERIHESGIDRSLDPPSTSRTSAMPNPTHTPSPSLPTINSSITATISENDTDTADFSCPHCPCTFTYTNLVGHLRIHRTEIGEPVPGVPTYTRRIRLNCLHCNRTLTHRIGLLGHMRIHENLR